MNARTQSMPNGTAAAHGADGVSLYVHVPFCSSKCAYCDFASFAVDVASPSVRTTFDEYCAAVMRDATAYSEAGLFSRVPSIYIGGGTPTVLGPCLPGFVADLRALPGVAPDAEVTCEANPESLDAELAVALAEAGVTRVSLGVQSLDDEVLEWLGRRHDAREALAATGHLRAAGLPFSVDLMCGIPVQSQGSWEWTVHDAVESGAGHVSVYPLTIEAPTPLSDAIDRGETADTDPDAAAQQMQHAAAALRAAGFERYEVASYARPGQECRHNVRYWTGGPYVGIGPGAASMLTAEQARAYLGDALASDLPGDAGRVRFTASHDLDAFLSGPRSSDQLEVEILTVEEALREDAMLGLRLSAGISGSLAEEAGVIPQLTTLGELGLIERATDADGESTRWRTTERGWLLGNEVFSRVWAGSER